LLGRIPFKYSRADQREPEFISVAAVPPGAGGEFWKAMPGLGVSAGLA